MQYDHIIAMSLTFLFSARMSERRNARRLTLMDGRQSFLSFVSWYFLTIHLASGSMRDMNTDLRSLMSLDGLQQRLDGILFYQLLMIHGGCQFLGILQNSKKKIGKHKFRFRLFQIALLGCHAGRSPGGWRCHGIKDTEVIIFSRPVICQATACFSKCCHFCIMIWRFVGRKSLEASEFSQFAPGTWNCKAETACGAAWSVEAVTLSLMYNCT